MPFNNFFNFNRFVLLMKQDLLIHRKKYVLTLTGLGLVTYLLAYWFLFVNKSSLASFAGRINELYMVCFAFFMMGVGVAVGTAFPELKDKIKTANYLLTPGSAFEKFLVQFMIRIGLFVPMALGIFWIVIRLAKASLIPEMLFGNQFFDPTLISNFEFRLLVTYGHNNEMWPLWEIMSVFVGIFSYGTYLFAGASYFKSYALIKSVVFSILVFFGCILLFVLLSHVFYPEETHGFNVQLESFPVTEDIGSIELAVLLLAVISWIFFLPVTYFKLKEKEA